MSETKPNIPLLRKAVEWAEAEAAKPPELCEWEQRWWVVPKTREEQAEWHTSMMLTDILDKAEDCGTCYCIAGFVVAATGGPMDSWYVDKAAADALGLTPLQADALFDGENTIEAVRRVAESIAAEAGERL